MRIAQTAARPIHPALLDIWRYTRHELLYVVWALMEIALIAPIALVAMPWARYWPVSQVTLWLALVMLIPFNLSRLMSLFRVPVTRQQTVMVVGLLLAILLSWRVLLFNPTSLIDLRWITSLYSHITQSSNPYWGRDVAVFILVTLFWWRGISLIGRRVDMKEIGLRFRLSGLIFAPIVITVASGLADWNVIPFLLLFFLASLLAIALTRAEQLEQDKSGLSFAMTPRWLAAVLLAAVIIILTSLILAGFASGEPLLGLAGWLQPVWLALHFIATTVIGILAYLALPFMFILSRVLQQMIDILGRAMQRGLAQLSPGTELGERPLFPELERAMRLQPEYRSLLIFLFMLLVVLGVALALNWVYRQMRPAAERDSELARAMGGGAANERPGLAGLLQRLGLGKGWRAAASIRRIYREMTLVAGAAGYGRGESETPYEYLNTLAKAWPDNAADINLITRAYVRVRYGEIPENRQELDEIKAAWERLEGKRPAGVEA
jgi:hypothetical protein